jgi:2-hydroxy-3-oxopropionate reductase
MVARLIEAGHEVVVLGRTAEKQTAIAELGANAVADTADVSAQAAAVLVCVFTDEQVRQVCLDDGLLATMSPGSALVVHTTGSPRTVETIAVRAAPHDVDVVDAPVSGAPHNAAAGALTLFVGGAEDAVARVRPVLSCYGDPILHVGPLGAGQKVKLVNNALFAAHLGLLSGSIELGARLGVPESTLLNALPHGSAASRACWTSSQGAGRSRRSSARPANSSAKTLAWSGVSPPSWAVTWACSTTLSTRP